jgi:hypothetical protein
MQSVDSGRDAVTDLELPGPLAIVGGPIRASLAVGPGRGVKPGPEVLGSGRGYELGG